jgi:hypothetical protein
MGPLHLIAALRTVIRPHETFWSQITSLVDRHPVPGSHQVNTMTTSRRQTLALFAFASMTTTLHQLAFAQAPHARSTAPAAGPDAQTIADAYIYLLGSVLVIRQERTDLKQAGIDYNVIKYNPCPLISASCRDARTVAPAD